MDGKNSTDEIIDILNLENNKQEREYISKIRRKFKFMNEQVQRLSTNYNIGEIPCKQSVE